MVICTLVTFSVVLSILPHVQAGARPGFELVTVFRGVPLAFEVEPLGMLGSMSMGVISSGGASSTHAYKNQNRSPAAAALAGSVRNRVTRDAWTGAAMTCPVDRWR